MSLKRLFTALTIGLPLVAGASDWTMLKENSRLEFTASYDQTPFDGRFESFDVSLDFDPASPAKAKLEVTVDITTVDTDNTERDEALADSDWFHFESHPRARFLVKGFDAPTNGSFTADGELELKGITRAQRIQFTWRRSGQGAVLDGVAWMDGEADVNRIDYDIGGGDWADPDLIGHWVKVRFHVEFEPRIDP
jgi:polyisoprenoid-binding protein YceI